MHKAYASGLNGGCVKRRGMEYIRCSQRCLLSAPEDDIRSMCGECGRLLERTHVGRLRELDSKRGERGTLTRQGGSKREQQGIMEGEVWERYPCSYLQHLPSGHCGEELPQASDNLWRSPESIGAAGEAAVDDNDGQVKLGQKQVK
jgi:hypothetical protein